MQQPRMIVLALIAQGRNYGLAMEEFVEASRMRQWAKIGSSTIYKALQDLKRDKCLSGKAGEAKRGPGKTTFAMTAKGKAELEERIAEALGSDAPVYSDRIAGLIFSVTLPNAKARKLVEGSIAGLEEGLVDLAREKARVKGDAIAEITLDYYRSIYRAEQKAMQAMLEKVL